MTRRTSQNSPAAVAWDSRPGADSPGEDHTRAEEGGNTRYTNKSLVSVCLSCPTWEKGKFTLGVVHIAATFWMLDGA